MRLPVILISMMLASIGLRKTSSENVSVKQNPKGFAVVELFTSEGCSSCPPADEVVAEIAKVNAEKVFVVGFHVDYWNRLGWKDQFSDHAYSERQKQYAFIFNLNSIYTPQVVVNGKKEFVGSDRSQLKKTIAAEIGSTSNLYFDINAESIDNKTITLNYIAEKNVAEILNIALIQRFAETSVKGGENSGRELKHINIARAFKSFDLNMNAAGNVKFEMPKGLGKRDCTIVAYLQDKKNFEIVCVGEAEIK